MEKKREASHCTCPGHLDAGEEKRRERVPAGGGRGTAMRRRREGLTIDQ
jgi:hypothetical protein